MGPESIFDTLKDQLDLERHGGRTPDGVLVRVVQRLLAITTAVWHNDKQRLQDFSMRPDTDMRLRR